jgi:signal transduction histidine kinase/ActR/RegA family two-component response regulator/PAS domain-containing protein
MTRALRDALGDAAARDESARLVSELESSFQRDDDADFLNLIRDAVVRWTRAGASSEAISRALLAMVRSKGLADPAAARDWISEMGPLLDFVPAPMAFTDLDMVIRAANPAFSQLTGESAEQLRDVSFASLLASGATSALFPETERSRSRLLRLDRVRLKRRPDRELLLSRVPFSPAGKPMGWFLTLARDAAEVITEASLSEMLEREKQQKSKFAALLTVSHAVTNSLDLQAVAMTIAKQVREVIQTDECTVFLYEEREEVLVPLVCDALTYVDEMMAVRLKLGEGITGTVALTGRGEIVNDAESDPRAITVPGTPPEQMALMCVPMLAQDRVVGVITLTRMGERGFQDEDLELATLFAGQCSAAIANARLYNEQRTAYEALRATQAQLVQSAKLNALGEMAGGVAHDFNNILAAILGRTQLLMQQGPDEETRRQLQVIEQAALDGAQTVRRVQEFTRVRQDERFETLDVNQVLLGVIELTRPVWESGAKRRGVSIDVHLELSASMSALGNASELREVFTNLVLNAVDAMPMGGDLWVTSENALSGVRVQVRDTGVGMNEDVRVRIFDPFFTTKAVKGTGLGLSVAYGIVTRHRGTIVCESEPGVGTVFTLEFPPGAAETERPPRAEEGPLPRMRVLVVDDEPSVLEVMVDLLAAMGMEVMSAVGGPAGVEAIRKYQFDIVFTDLGMPEMNGWDLALAVKSSQPETAVVLVTGWGFQLEEEAAASRGVDLVIAKPFSWDDVLGALRFVVDLREARKVA